MKNENVRSFNSSNSFESFGSMGSDEAVVILNPCDYTVYQLDHDLDNAEINNEIVEENTESNLIKKGLIKDNETAVPVVPSKDNEE